MLLSEDYIVTKFYQYAGFPRYNRLSKSYNGCCPTCREGTSWGKKRRLYYIPKKNIVFCHNCGLNMRPVKWIQQVSNMSYVEIMRENGTLAVREVTKENIEFSKPVTAPDLLPKDSINLFDSSQVSFYKNNNIINKCIDLIKYRRLDVACNRPPALFVSLNDSIHKNRLIIPFYGLDGKIYHYQTRTVINSQKSFPKYLSKQQSEKGLFGINQVQENSKYIFVTEGPIDAFFIKNGVAVAGITESKQDPFTKIQKDQLGNFPLHDIIWILDNQYKDQASRKKTSYLLKLGYKVFLWPEKLKCYKDINEYCIDKKLNGIEEEFILENITSGVKGRLMLSQY